MLEHSGPLECLQHHRSSKLPILVELQGLRQTPCGIADVAWHPLLHTPSAPGRAERLTGCLQGQRMDQIGQLQCPQRQRCLCCRPLLKSKGLRGW